MSGITDCGVAVLSAVTFSGKANSALDAGVVDFGPLVAATARLRRWDILPEGLGLVEEGQQIVGDVDAELLLELCSVEHIFGRRVGVAEAEHQAHRQALHLGVRVGALDDGEKQFANVHQLEVAAELIDVGTLTELTHVDAAGLLEQLCEGALKEALSVGEEEIDGVDVAHEDGGEDSSHCIGGPHIGFLLGSVLEEVDNGLSALVAGEQGGSQDADLAMDLAFKLDRFLVVLHTELLDV